MNKVSAVSVSDVSSSDVTAGNLQLLVSNEILPQDVTDVVVSVSAIDIHVQHGSYVSVSTDALSLDLAQLNLAAASLVQSTVAAGTYDGLRITLSGVAVSYANGDSMSYTFSSSDASSGANEFYADIYPALTLSASAVSHLLIDIGALTKNHGHGRGAPPQANAHSELIPPFQVIDLDTTGEIGGAISASSTDSSGTVSSIVVADAHVLAVQGGQVIGMTRTDANGNYYIFGLPAGTYDVIVDKPEYQLSVNSNITVSVGANSSEDVVLVASSGTSSSSISGPNSNSSAPAFPWDGGSKFDHP